MISRKSWRIWFVLSLTSFAVMEGIAIFNGEPGDTLSEYVWTYGTAFRGILAGLLVWLALHFRWKV